MNRNVCELGPKTEELAAIKAEIERCLQKGKDKIEYKRMLKTLIGDERRRWLRKQDNKAYWLAIAEEVRNAND